MTVYVKVAGRSYAIAFARRAVSDKPFMSSRRGGRHALGFILSLSVCVCVHSLCVHVIRCVVRPCVKSLFYEEV